MDSLLQQAADAGLFVSTHPEIIRQMGTKEVLFRTRHMEWGGAVRRYETTDEARTALLPLLKRGAPRVLKRNRGNAGNGVWRVELRTSQGNPAVEPRIRVLPALRQSEVQEMSLNTFLEEIAVLFSPSDPLIDQPFYSPASRGMVRCYVSGSQVVGFGHQYVTALDVPSDGSAPPDPTPRVYYDQAKPEFQALRQKMEADWIPVMCEALGISADALPVIWDADFLYGPPAAAGEDAFILCEINVSSVFPFPDSALPYLADAAVTHIAHRRSR